MDQDKQVAEAKAEARRAQRLAWVWWALVPLVTVVYWIISKEPPIEKVMLVFLADVSIVANAVSYETKAKAAEAKAAGYEHP